MNRLMVLAVVAAGFAVVLVGLAVIAHRMGVPLSKLVGEDGDTPAEKGGVDLSVYEQCEAFLSNAELNFYRLLVKVLAHPNDPKGEPQTLVMAKVRVPDLVQVRKGLDRSARSSAFNRIKSKHVDFVLCEPESMRAVCVIELDDKSHKRQSRQDRDELMDSIYAAVGLPVLHVDCRRGYSMQEIGGMIREAVGRGA